MSAMGQFFGGVFLSAFLQVAFDRLATPEFMDFVHRWKIDLNEVESLKQTSAVIQALYDEAEVKQFTNVPVKLWLGRLKQLLYDAEDILDEYAIEVQRLKLESEHQTKQVRNLAPPTPSESSVSSLVKFGIESAVKGISETLEGIKGIGPKVFDFAEELQGIKRFGSKVRDIDERLKSVAQEGVALGLSFGIESGYSNPKVFSERPRSSSSLVYRPDVFGRKEDEEKILEWLISDKSPSPIDNANNFSVLPIVAMGGAGKTTLAQFVYSNERVKKHFSLKGWVCVSEDFDEVRLTKDILESVTGSSPTSKSLDRLQVTLQEALSEKRFLLVLDDMWNENYDRWNTLRTPFAFGAPGSKILVTIRNKGVASILRTGKKDHDLIGLSDDACFALIRRHAFNNGNSSDANQKLESFGKAIVKKCKGLPLAVKTLAGLLRDKSGTNEWEAILDDKIWDLKEKTEILPSLMLSYHHLPPVVKRCFAYCALFPKDYVFHKIELVMLWMAEGIIQPKGKKRLEDIGAEYFDELFMRSFFELSERRPSNWVALFYEGRNLFTGDSGFYELSNELYIRSFFESSDLCPSNKASSLSPIIPVGTRCSRSLLKPSSDKASGFMMHDLIHDLAQFVSSGIYCRREYNESFEVFLTTRHLSFLTNSCNVEEREFEAMKNLRTLLDVNGRPNHGYDRRIFHASKFQFQFQFQFLRVLRIRDYCSDEVSDSIGKLKHLRLLDLSFPRIVRLPNSITSLCNLQTLVLVCCWRLRELPEDMCKLVNLRHIFLPSCIGWASHSYNMPLGVNNFTGLQTLSRFVVGPKNGSELRDLSQLRGSLIISNLENIVNDGVEAMVVNLKNKKHLLGLQLHWSEYDRGDSFQDLGRDEKVEEKVLDQLHPPTNLEALRIENYGGMRFPSWIEHLSFFNLEVVILIGCQNCRFLPHLWQLPVLKHLVIRECNAIKVLGSEALCGDGSLSANKKFQSLGTLYIECMEELEEWPQVIEEEDGEGQFPCLRELGIDKCPKLRLFSHRFPSLVKLKIIRCHGLIKIPQFLPSLRLLDINECPNLVVLPGLPSIEHLMLDSCQQITALSDFEQPSQSMSIAAPSTVNNSFPCLSYLDIWSCPNLRELPSFLPSLETLDIRGCEELCFLPMLPSIKHLLLAECKGIVLNNNNNNDRTIMSDHLSSLSSLTLSHLSDLKSLPEDGFVQHLTVLQRLSISNCKELTALVQSEIEGLQNLKSLQVLQIFDCENLESLPKELNTLTSLQEFDIWGCPLLSSFEEAVLSFTLQKLMICDCKSLESLPKELHTLMSLQELQINRCPVLLSFQEAVLPSTLQKLSITNCENLESLPMGLLDNLMFLQRLELYGYPNLKSLPEGLHKLTFLQRLEISQCPAFESFPDMGLPTSLRYLWISHCMKLNSLPKGLHKLTNLQHLRIEECAFLMVSKDLEPLCRGGIHNFTSLSSLSIHGCPILESIPRGLLPPNLKSFYIKDCPILESLHDIFCDLTTLKYLSIRNCPMLTYRYIKKEGEEWSKISQIPDLTIDGDTQYPDCS